MIRNLASSIAVLLLVCASASAALTYQSKKANTAAGGTATLVFTATPTVGDLLLCGDSNDSTPSTPSGWTVIDTATTGSTIVLTIFRHIVGSSEANSYAFTAWNLECYDINGQVGSGYIDAHSIKTQSSSTPITSTGVTPTVVGDLAIAFAATVSQTMLFSSVSTGWTVDQSNQGNWEPGWGVSKTARTTDTTTSIGLTFTGTNTSDTYALSVVLVAPLAATGAPGRLIGFGQ